MYEKLLTLAQTADLLGVSKSLIYKMSSKKTLKVIRIGSAIRVDPSSLGIPLSKVTAPAKDAVSPPTPIILPTKSELLLKILPEVEKAFENPPVFGEIGVRVVLHDSVVLRIESSRSVLKKMPNKS